MSTVFLSRVYTDHAALHCATCLAQLSTEMRKTAYCGCAASFTVSACMVEYENVKFVSDAFIVIYHHLKKKQRNISGKRHHIG